MAGLPLPVLGEIDRQLRIRLRDYGRYRLLASPAVATDVFLDRARGVRHHPNAASAGQRRNLVSEDIEERRPSIGRDEGLLHGDHGGLEVADQLKDCFASFPEILVRCPAAREYLHPVIQETLPFQEGDAHLPGAWIDGKDTNWFSHLCHAKNYGIRAGSYKT